VNDQSNTPSRPNETLELQSAPDITIIVMAFNERETLDPTCRELLAKCSEIGLRTELVIVDDGSTDGTDGIARAIAATDSRVRVVHHVPNRGLGGVYRTGFSEARGKYVTFFPADGQFPATIIEQFLEHIQQHDFVLGYLSVGTRSMVPSRRWSGLFTDCCSDASHVFRALSCFAENYSGAIHCNQRVVGGPYLWS
jgi:glycosyltransferase involved in cell wall biosynthesis